MTVVKTCKVCIILISKFFFHSAWFTADCFTYASLVHYSSSQVYLVYSSLPNCWNLKLSHQSFFLKYSLLHHSHISEPHQLMCEVILQYYLITIAENFSQVCKLLRSKLSEQHLLRV